MGLTPFLFSVLMSETPNLNSLLVVAFNDAELNFLVGQSRCAPSIPSPSIGTALI
jgi:hypothetical protein